MDITVIGYLGLLVAVALLRIFELRVSRRHQQSLVKQGAVKVNQPSLLWLALVHTGVLICAALEVVFLRRPFIPLLAAIMLVLFIGANVVRLWVVITMGQHWNVQVVNSTSLGVIVSGPFRFVRHPNYAAVFVELFSLPLIHTAWLTALVGSLVHAVAISQRISVEESVLLANAEYRAAMAAKPRFLPGLF